MSTQDPQVSGGSFGNLNEIINKYSDIVLAGLVVSVIAMIVIPLPTWLLDLLLTLQLTMAVIIILAALLAGWPAVACVLDAVTG